MVNLGTIVAFLSYFLVVFLLCFISYRSQKPQSFLKEYYLCGRSLGPWTLAFTFAATSASAGSFMGFPSLIYRYGWILALWIAGYTVVPLVTMGVLGKRLNQVARYLGSITIPDLLRDRFQSETLGVLASVLIIIFQSAFMLAQFKAGGLIMNTLFGFSYETGLIIFSLSVILYTSVGGFRAVVWTDVMQGIFMVLGVLVMLPLALKISGGLNESTSILFTRNPALVHVPGPSVDGTAFLPLGLAASFFLIFTLGAMAQPSTLVRLMAFRDSKSLSRALILVCIYFSLVYIPLVIIFTISRSILPPLEVSDQVMPLMATFIASPFIAGILIAAPYAAIMSSVDSFLLLVSSSCSRDIYQRVFNPQASEKKMRTISQASTVVVGSIVMLLALNPPELLQYVIIFASSGLAAGFLAQILMALFWRRATAKAAISAMLSGAGMIIVLYIAKPILVSLGYSNLASTLQIPSLMGLDPFVWSIGTSLTVGITVSLIRPLQGENRIIKELFPNQDGPEREL